MKKLLIEGHQLRCLDNNSRGNKNRLRDIFNDIEYIEGDICNLDIVNKAVKGVDSVIHLAYVNGTEFFYTHPELVLNVAVRGMVNILDACREHNVSELVLASSSEVYQTPAVIPTDETVALVVPDVLNPRYSYGGGKLISELLAINYGRKQFDRVIIFRPHNVYGPDMGREHVLPQLILRAVKLIEGHTQNILPFPIQGDGSQTRAFIHIDDFIEGLNLILRKGEHLNIYHIGNPEEVSIKQIVEYIAKYFSRRFNIVSGEEPQGSTKRRCPDIAKLKALGFMPKINFANGFPSIAKWYANHGEMYAI